MYDYISKIMVILISGTFINCEVKRRNKITNSNNIALISVSISQQKIYHPGEPITVQFEIGAENVYLTGLPVHFSMIHLHNVEQLKESLEAETYEVGDYLMDKIPDGVSQFSADLIIPPLVAEGGQYIMVAYIDPGNLILPKTMTTSHRFSDGYSKGHADNYGFLSISLDDYHDYHLTEISLNQDYILLEVPGAAQSQSDKNESDIVGHVHVTQFGKKDISPYLKAEIKINEQWIGLDFWAVSEENPDSQIYKETLSLDFKYNSESHYFSFDIRLSESILQDLHKLYNHEDPENLIEIRFSVEDQSSNQEANHDNNSLSKKVSYRFYPHESDTFDVQIPGEPVGQIQLEKNLGVNKNFGKKYSKLYGDKRKIAVDLNIGTDSSMSSDDYKVAFDHTSEMSFYIFNQKAEIFSTKAKAFAYGKTLFSGYEAVVSVLGNKVINSSLESYEALSQVWDQSWSESAELFKTVIVVSVVPIEISIGIEGSVGYGAKFEFSGPKLSATGRIFSSSLKLVASADVNLVAASAGLSDELLIIDDNLTLTETAEFSSSQTTLSLNLENEINAIDGEFYLWATYPTYNWCCSLEETTKKKIIYQTDTLYNKKWSILSANSTLTY